MKSQAGIRTDAVRSISLVGNGPVSKGHAALIDAADLVIRINRANLCGVAGRRTDVIVIFHRFMGRSVTNGLPINPRAETGAREFWLQQSDKPGPAKSTEQLRRHVLRGRPVRFINIKIRAAELLGPHGATEHTKASTGAAALAYILDTFPDAKIGLYGFSHRGAAQHDWNAERAWFDALEAEGRVTHPPMDGPPLKLPLRDVLHVQTLRLRNHIRRLIGRS